MDMEFTVTDTAPGSGEIIAERIDVGIDFQHAISADSRQHVRGGDEADSTTEEVRAEHTAGPDGLLGDFDATGEAAPFHDVRLDNRQGTGRNRFVEIAETGNVFAA